MLVKCVKSTYEKAIFHISAESIVAKLMISSGNYINEKYGTEKPREATLPELVV